jgi:hypothetical protein
MPETADRARVKAFANWLLDIYNGGFLTYMIEMCTKEPAGSQPYKN